MAFLPLTKAEAEARGWAELDIIFVSGDAYVDHPAFGVPLLARLLESRGFRVGIISQPDWRTRDSFTVLGRPRLFFAVAAGAMDSMVAHYTPARKLRHDDAYTPGNRHGARPNRACIVYTSRIKEVYKDVPVIIGGIEASLRRFAHYDFWEDRLRRSILFDAKADMLVYGMGERPLLEIAERMSHGELLDELTTIRGTAIIARDVSQQNSCNLVELPSWEQVSADKLAFASAFRLAERELNPYCGSAVVQRHGDRFLICNPPSLPLGEAELDELYGLPFEKAPHPSYSEKIPAYEQIRCSITTHRGCMGGCSFCAITFHQGKIIQSRSDASILAELGKLAKYPWFSGTVSDLGGPTANMYGMRCDDHKVCAACRRDSCVFPDICNKLYLADQRSAALLQAARAVTGIKHIFVASGIRFDLLAKQRAYARELLKHHVGGLLKVAPEHLVDSVSRLMRKPALQIFTQFLERFRSEAAISGKRIALIPYFMSGHPGCTLDDMLVNAQYLKKLNLKVEQVQDFTPTPGTRATCMYYSGVDPETGNTVYVAKGDKEKSLQKSLLLHHLHRERAAVMKHFAASGNVQALNILADLCNSGPTRTFQGRPMQLKNRKVDTGVRKSSLLQPERKKHKKP